MVANLQRLLRHLLSPPWRVKQVFPARAMHAIEAAIRDSETRHEGEIRFAVEAALDPAPLLGRQSARQRAIDVFSQLRIWDTERNNGVLVYLLLADRDVEIVADRGIHALIGTEEWERICAAMEQAFRHGRFEEGVIAGIRAVSEHLVKHYPRQGYNPNELPNAPVVL